MTMAGLEIVFRVLLGLMFFIFGWNGFLKKIPIPPAAEPMNHFIAALEATGFLMTFVKIFEIIAGALLLLNYHPLLAIHILAPLVFVILTSQLFLNRKKGLGISAVLLILYLGTVAPHFQELWIY
jgi:uncharacterized membrane protein YphA (DoxX/SURF4 family)